MTERVLVRDLMTVGVKTCAPTTPIVDLARFMLEQDLEAIVVLDHEGHAVGVVSRDDLVRADVIFSATGVTSGSLLAGIKREPGWVTLETILMRSKTGSVRRMTYKSPLR